MMVSFYNYLLRKRNRICWRYIVKKEKRAIEDVLNLFDIITTALSPYFRTKKIYMNCGCELGKKLGRANAIEPLDSKMCIEQIKIHLNEHEKKDGKVWLRGIAIRGGTKIYYEYFGKKRYDWIDGTYDLLQIDDTSDIDIEEEYINAIEIDITPGLGYDIRIIPWLNVYTEDDGRLDDWMISAYCSKEDRMKNALQFKKMLKIIEKTTNAEFDNVLGPEEMPGKHKIPEVYRYGYKWVENINEEEYLK